MTKKLKKADLVSIIWRIYDIASRQEDPYDEDGMRLNQIHDITAQVLGKEEIIPGCWDIESIVGKD